MSKETAVELLVDAIRGHIAEGTLDAITLSRAKMIAKAMEREQIEDAYKGCYALRDTMDWEFEIGWTHSAHIDEHEESLKKYYIETYSGGKHE